MPFVYTSGIPLPLDCKPRSVGYLVASMDDIFVIGYPPVDNTRMLLVVLVAGPTMLDSALQIPPEATMERWVLPRIILLSNRCRKKEGSLPWRLKESE